MTDENKLHQTLFAIISTIVKYTFCMYLSTVFGKVEIPGEWGSCKQVTHILIFYNYILQFLINLILTPACRLILHVSYAN